MDIRFTSLLLTLLIKGFNCIYDEEGPSFLEEPPSKIEFLNDRGIQLNCTVDGRPAPTITWTKADGSEVADIPGMRYALSSGELIFKPFQAHAFRPDVHSATYRCTARNRFGTVVSRDTRIRAVVRQSYEPVVKNTMGTKNFPVVLHCVIPNFVRDFVSVTSWIHGSLNILPSSGFEMEKYELLEEGQLLIWQVAPVDSFSSYQCRTFDRLTGETRISAPASLIVSEETDERRPKIHRSVSTTLIAKENERVILPCIATGNPHPSHKWSKKDENKFTPVMDDSISEDAKPSRHALDESGISIRHGSLVISSVRMSHKGTYICNATNSLGYDILEIQLIIRSSIVVNLEPGKSTVDVGKNADFTCFASGEPQPTVQWMKDGRIIRPTNTPNRIRFYGQQRIQVIGVQREDQGVYQCIARNEFESTQRSAQLWLGDSPAKLLYHFIEQSLQPGPPVSLKCSATGNPTPHISWLLDGFELPKSDRFLMGQYANIYGDVISHVNITSVQVEDGGQYECIASNRAGQESHGAPLNVYGAPYVRQVGEITAVAGKTLKFKCPVGGYPIDTISYEKEGKKLQHIAGRQHIRDGALFIENIERTDEGRYKCRAQNKAGQFSEMSVKVRVVVPPKITPFSFPARVQVKERTGVQCIVSTGDPPFQITWIKDTISLTTENLPSPSSLSASKSRAGNEFSISAPSSTKQQQQQQHQQQSKSSKKREKTVQAERGSLKILIGHSEFSSYLNIPSISVEHMGNYTCLAKSLISGEMASYTAALTVNAAIKISKFSFEDGLIADRGMRAQVICAATEGEPDQITWLRNNVKIIQPNSWAGSSPPSPSPANPYYSPAEILSGLSIDRFGQFSSILSIVNVSAVHSGLYKCILANKFGHTSHEAALIVRVPPKFVIEPKDHQVSIGTQVHIDCQADGSPAPKIFWKQLVGPLENKEYRDVGYRTPGILAADNGTLIINRVTEDHAGYYSCIARQLTSGPQQHHNQHSQHQPPSPAESHVEITKVIHVTVNAPPRIKPRPPKEIVRRGERAVLKCEATGDEPLHITWFAAQDVRVVDILDSRYSVSTQNRVSELSISQVSPSDHGDFECTATNPFGRDQIKVSLLVQEKPQKPKNLNVEERTSRSVILSWTKATPEEPPVLNYVLAYKEDAESWEEAQTKKVSTSGDNNSITLDDLKPATNYDFRLFARNSQGNSDFSDVLQERTASEPPSGPPVDVFVEAVSSTQLRVTWKPPKLELINGQLLGYIVRYGIKREDTGHFNWSRRVESTLADPLEAHSLFIENLDKYQAYRVSIQAFNEMGGGPFSETAFVSTFEDVPSAPPENIQCSPGSAHSLQISWDPPPTSNIHGILEGFRILAEALPDVTDTADFQNPSAVQTPVVTSSVLHNLQPFTNYSIQVAAFTRVGHGVYSASVYCLTEESVPSEPSAIKAVASAADSVYISWLPPKFPNGRILRFKVYIRMLGSGRDFPSVEHVPSSQLNFKLSGLKAQESYEAWVTAITSAGEGQSTLAIPFTSAKSENTEAAIISFGTVVVVPFKRTILLPCNYVGSGVTVQWRKQDVRLTNSSRVTILDNSSLLIEAAERNDSGNLSCYVKNKYGSDVINYIIKVQVVPSAPLLHPTGVSNTSVVLQWKQGDNGGAPLMGYTLVYKKVGAAWEEMNLHRKLLNYEVTNLLCGTSYQFFLTGYNKIGSGEPSQTVEVNLKGSRPSIPPLNRFFTANATSFYLHFSDWANTSADCPITSYTVEFKPRGGTWKSVEGTDSHVVGIHGLAHETEYRLRIIAHNAAGTASKEFSASTYPANGERGLSTSLSSSEFKLDFNTTLLIGASVTSFISVFIGVCFLWKFWKKKKYRQGGMLSQSVALARQDSDKDYSTEKRAKYISDCDLIPENEDDIQPYATFPIPLDRSFRGNLPDNYIYGPDPTRIPIEASMTLRSSNNFHPSAFQGYGGTGKRKKSKGNTSLGRSESLKVKVKATGESDEYDSLGSDSEGVYDPVMMETKSARSYLNVSNPFLAEDTTLVVGDRDRGDRSRKPPFPPSRHTKNHEETSFFQGQSTARVPLPQDFMSPIFHGSSELSGKKSKNNFGKLDFKQIPQPQCRRTSEQQLLPCGGSGVGSFHNSELDYSLSISPLHSNWKKSTFPQNDHNNFELFRYLDDTIAV